MNEVFATLALVLALAQEPADHGARLQQLEAEYQTALSEFFRPFMERKDEVITPDELDFAKHPAREYLPRFRALADEAQGTDAGADALFGVLRVAGDADQRDEARKALQQLEAYADRPAAKRVAEGLRYAWWSVGAEPCAHLLEQIVDRSPDAEARAAALLSLGEIRIGGQEPAKARAAFDRLLSEFPETDQAKQAQGFLFELDNLQVGMTAPDFEATDQHGATFRLSDHRGKVVLLYFWGFW